MRTPTDVISAARACVGTPFQHLGRTPGLGLDCVGLIVTVARTLGVTQYDYAHYARFSTDNQLVTHFGKSLLAWPGELTPGLVVAMRTDRRQMHAGILGLHPSMPELTLIHALNKPGILRVCEHILDEEWRSRILCSFAYPGVTY